MRISSFAALVATVFVAFAIVTVRPTAQVSRPPGSWIFPDTEVSWFSGAADLDGDGSEELIMSTMSSAGSASLTDPTPTYIVGVSNGAITDRSAEFFATQPRVWSVRTIVTGDFNGDGRRDLMLCNEGRRPSEPALKTNPRTPGMWGEQSQVWLSEGGRLVDRTATFPQSIAICHGASAGDVDKSGRASIIVNTVGGVVNDSGAYPPYPSTYLAKWNGSQFVWTSPFPPGTGSRAGKGLGFYTDTADFNGDGFADVVGEVSVTMGVATGFLVRSITPSAVETDYPIYNGTAVGDVNGDGLPDVVKIQSTKAAILGATFALYLGNAVSGLVEKPDAFPAVASYNITDFNAEISLIDVNFDGALDIVTRGRNYPGTAGTIQRTVPDAVWLNDGSGRFALAHFTDSLVSGSACGGPKGAFSSVYFLKTGSPSAFNLVAGTCSAGFVGLTARLVTPAKPLTFVR